MYFVVYFIRAEKFLVIPHHWIYQHEIALQKFINYSLNSNQKFMCYYAQNVHANLLSRHVPNFHAPYVNEFPFNGEEGRFIGLMKRSFHDYDDALNFSIKLRHQPPPIYNERRLVERPIPFTGNIEMDSDEFDISDEESIGNSVTDDSETNVDVPGISHNESNDTTMISIDEESAIDPLETSIKIEESYVVISESDRVALYSYLNLSGEENASINTVTASTSSTNGSESEMHTNSSNILNGDNISTNTVPITPESNLSAENKQSDNSNAAENEASSNDTNEVDERTGDTAENVSSDDIEMVLITDTFPQPIVNVSESGLTKYEDDVISGNLPYAIKKDGSRIYEVGSINRRIKIGKDILKTFLAWNTVPFATNPFYDRKITHALLMMIVGRSNVAYQIDCNVKNFVREFLSARTNASSHRMDKLQQYVDEYIKQYADN